MKVPQWLISSEDSFDPAQAEADLTETFRQRLLDRLPDTEEGARMRERATNQFQLLLQDLGIIDPSKYGKTMDDFEYHVLPNMIEKDMKGMDLKRLESTAKQEALRSVSRWRLKQDRYVLWAITNSKDVGWWMNLSGEFEVSTFEEYARMVWEEFKTTDPDNQAYDWQWICEVLIPLLKSHGASTAEAVRAVTLKGKLRSAKSRLKFIYDQYADTDPERAVAEIVDIIENEVLNPKVSAAEIKKKAPGYRGLTNDNKIPGSATSRFITDDGEYLVIRTSSPAQSKAIEMATRGLVDETDGSAFFPRDALAMFNETKQALQGRRCEVLRDPLPEVTPGALEVILPFQLSELFIYGREIVDQRISWAVGDDYYGSVAQYEMVGFARNEIHVKFYLNVSKKEE